jgi:hypothetical protein
MAKTQDVATRPYGRQALRSQLIVTTRPDPRMSLAALEDAVAAEGGALEPLFGRSRGHLREHLLTLRARGARVPDLGVFHAVTAPEARYTAIARRVGRVQGVTGAYVKPPADAPASTTTTAPAGATTAYSCAETWCTPLGWAPTPTPDLSPSQGYLDPAPEGIDARYAWTRGDGTGVGVEIVDVEREWRFTHEDLVAGGGLAGGFPVDCIRERNHGAAILGILSGDDNAFGITGICPDAGVRGVSTRQPGVPENGIPGTADTARAICEAADLLTQTGAQLDTGHIILLELQRVGPGGYNIAVEWWWDDLVAIRYATSLGLIVVEAAGNGHPDTGAGTSLDHARYQTADPGFPALWTNPFRRAAVDSGAIIVGAGAPPVGTVRADRSRLSYSNWGACVDAQGWGDEVVTSGYGCLQGGANEDRWYVADFGGTSAASAMVAGALACVQGFLRGRGAPPLTSASARALVRADANGSPQQPDGAQYPRSQRIGPRPNLRKLIARVAARGATPVARPPRFPRNPPFEFRPPPGGRIPPRPPRPQPDPAPPSRGRRGARRRRR